LEEEKKLKEGLELLKKEYQKPAEHVPSLGEMKDNI